MKRVTVAVILFASAIGLATLDAHAQGMGGPGGGGPPGGQPSSGNCEEKSMEKYPVCRPGGRVAGSHVGMSGGASLSNWPTAMLSSTQLEWE